LCTHFLGHCLDDDDDDDDLVYKGCSAEEGPISDLYPFFIAKSMNDELTETVFYTFNPTAYDFYFGKFSFVFVLSVLFNDALNCRVYTREVSKSTSDWLVKRNALS
jgi:hypothetical protein